LTREVKRPMSRFEIRIAGMGGQGIVMAGVMIGRAASIFGGKNVTMAQSYGPESRGGASKTEVMVSDERIDYPKIRKPNLIAIMSHEAYAKSLDDLNQDNVIVVIDPDVVQEDESTKTRRIFRVPATRIAEGLGKRIVANMVMVGAIVALTGAVDPAAVEKAIAKYTPRGTEKLNLDAFRRGYEFARQQLSQQTVIVQ
jgi:2-oxoglutarate ferredoxin oxidoreductase subunit gamma